MYENFIKCDFIGINYYGAYKIKYEKNDEMDYAIVPNSNQDAYGFTINTDGDVELSTKSYSYILTEGDELDLMKELVYTPEDLLDYLGNLSWGVSGENADGEPVATVVDGVLTANTAGTATATLFTDLFGDPEEIGSVTIIVLEDSHEDIPAAGETTDEDGLTPVKKDENDTATQDSVLAETKDLVETLINDDEEAVEEILETIESVVEGATVEDIAEALIAAL